MGRVIPSCSICLIVVKPQLVAFPYASISIQEHKGLIVHLTAHGLHILILLFRTFHTIIDSTEESPDIGPSLRNHIQRGGLVTSLQQFKHAVIVSIQLVVSISANLSTVLGQQCILWDISRSRTVESLSVFVFD